MDPGESKIMNKIIFRKSECALCHPEWSESKKSSNLNNVEVKADRVPYGKTK